MHPYNIPKHLISTFILNSIRSSIFFNKSLSTLKNFYQIKFCLISHYNSKQALRVASIPAPLEKEYSKNGDLRRVCCTFDFSIRFCHNR